MCRDSYLSRAAPLFRLIRLVAAGTCLKEKKLLKNKPVHRVVFYEITQNAVKSAIEEPRDISMPLVNAQQARRALDYLVGFNLSPLLWRKIRRGLSAGRVQSPALRLICEREAEIEAFTSQEYWSIHLDSRKGKQKFSAKLFQFEGKKLEQFDIGDEKASNKVLEKLKKAGDKAKVEAGVLIAERQILAALRDQRFFSLGELNQAIAQLVAKLCHGLVAGR